MFIDAEIFVSPGFPSIALLASQAFDIINPGIGCVVGSMFSDIGISDHLGVGNNYLVVKYLLISVGCRIVNFAFFVGGTYFVVRLFFVCSFPKF